jgi:hypothetical protein
LRGSRAPRRCFSPTVDLEIVRFWLLLLVTFDVVFVVLALWTFEAVMSD